MNGVVVRPAEITDCSGITEVYRGESGWWGELEECKCVVSHRVSRGFYNQVALLNNKIVGHGEWILDENSEGKALFLGMLQIHSEFQRKGIGRIMLDDGEIYAQKSGCNKLVTVPEPETTSGQFYEKCGFQYGRKIFYVELSAIGYTQYKNDYKQCEDGVPFQILRELPFVFGVTQPSPRHMWEIFNHPHEDEDKLFTVMAENRYIQLRGSESSMVLYWGDIDENSVTDTLCFANNIRIEAVTFYFFEEHLPIFASFNAAINEEGVEMYKILS